MQKSCEMSGSKIPVTKVLFPPLGAGFSRSPCASPHQLHVWTVCPAGQGMSFCWPVPSPASGGAPQRQELDCSNSPTHVSSGLRQLSTFGWDPDGISSRLCWFNEAFQFHCGFSFAEATTM